jgi:hypothetical protein
VKQLNEQKEVQRLKDQLAMPMDERTEEQIEGMKQSRLEDERVQAFLSGYLVYMLQDASFDLYAACRADSGFDDCSLGGNSLARSTRVEQCDCIDGYLPDAIDFSRCRPLIPDDAPGGATIAVHPGTTVSRSPNGKLVTISLADGTVRATDSEAITRVDSADGRITVFVDSADGSNSTLQVHSDGAVSTIGSDGTTKTVKAVNKTDGSTMARLDDGGTTTTTLAKIVNASGTRSINSTEADLALGSLVATYGEGTKVHLFNNGTAVAVEQWGVALLSAISTFDGQLQTEFLGGSQRTVGMDGKVTTVMRPGGFTVVTQLYANGTLAVKHDSSKAVAEEPPLLVPLEVAQVNSIFALDSIDSMPADHAVTSLKTVLRDGTTIAMSSDGNTITTTNSDGAQIATYSDGVRIAASEGGDAVVIDSKEGKLTTGLLLDDGTAIVAGSDGIVRTVSIDGRQTTFIRPDGSATTIFVQDDNSVTVKDGLGGGVGRYAATILVSDPESDDFGASNTLLNDGTEIAVSVDGASIIISNPTGEEIVTNFVTTGSERVFTSSDGNKLRMVVKLQEKDYRCANVTVMGPISAELAKGSDSIQAAISSAYDDCFIFYDCDGDGLQDDAEAACVLVDGRCHLPGISRNALDHCNAVLEPVKQSTRKCMASVGSDSDVIVEATVQPSPCIPQPSIAATADSNKACSPLCQQYSCDELEGEFETNIQSGALGSGPSSFAFGSEHPSMTTIADTINACVFCEDGDSADHSQCIFTDPEKKAKHWRVCDPLCDWETCDEIEKLVSDRYTSAREARHILPHSVGTYVHRFVHPLCSGCSSASKCVTGQPKASQMIQVALNIPECVDAGVPPQMNDYAGIKDCAAVVQEHLCDSALGKNYCAKTCGACTATAVAVATEKEADDSHGVLRGSKPWGVHSTWSWVVGVLVAGIVVAVGMVALYDLYQSRVDGLGKLQTPRADTLTQTVDNPVLCSLSPRAIEDL